jgi:uncharacterized protein
MQGQAQMHIGDYEVVIEEGVMIPMRDGTRLAQDIYRPANGGRPADGRFPVLLERTPYGKQGVRQSEYTASNPVPVSRRDIALDFARRGYVVVIQDCRGRHQSEGVFTKYLDEAEDGFDTLSWIHDQVWCDGAIGMFGLSYSAHTQTAAAVMRPPGLKALILDCGGLANAYRTGVRQGGALELKQATWAFKHARQSATCSESAAAALDAEDIAEWFKAWPWKRGHSPLRWMPEYENFFFDQLEQDCFGPFWDRPALHAAPHYDAFEGMAVLLMSGWYDPYAQSTVEHFSGLSERESGAVEMILGPWLHGQRSSTHSGAVSLGPHATLDGQLAPDYPALRLDWFDHHLRGLPRQYGAGAVHYFRMGEGNGASDTNGRLVHGGRWLSTPEWPPQDIDPQNFHLGADGALTLETARERSISFVHDPRHPVPTIGGAITSGAPVMYGGAYDQKLHPGVFGASPPWLPMAARSDVLVFESAPLEVDLEVTGSPQIMLSVSVDAFDADFTAKLIDVHPPSPDFPQGFAMNLTDGIMRCRFRNGWTKAEPLESGKVVQITIELPPISNLFAKGHRIRLDIAGSNYPRFDINRGTGNSGQDWRLVTQTIHCGQSRVVLPVIRRRDAE